MLVLFMNVLQAEHTTAGLISCTCLGAFTKLDLTAKEILRSSLCHSRARWASRVVGRVEVNTTPNSPSVKD